MASHAMRSSHDSASAARPRPLNEPVPLPQVETNPDGEPVAIMLRGRPRPVTGVIERWKVDEGWWRPDPVSRRYYRLVLDDGRIVTVFRDLEDGREGGSWWTQRP